MNKKVTFIISMLIGALFLTSGFGKAMNAGRFGNLIAQYGFAPLQHTAPLIIVAEMLVGAFLLLQIRTRIMLLTSLAMLVVFTMAYAYGYFVNNISDCGCFGSMNVGISGPFFTFTRNFLLIGLSFFAWLKMPITADKIASWKKIILYAVLLPSIYLTGYTFRTPIAFWEKDRIHPWVNKNITDTPLSDYLTVAPDSSYLFAFISYDCFYCWNSVANFKQIRESGLIDKVVAYAQTGDTSRMQKGLLERDRNRFTDYFGSDVISAEIGYDHALRKHVTHWPTFFYITNDTIRVVIESTLPSSLAFQQMFIGAE